MTRLADGIDDFNDAAHRPHIMDAHDVGTVHDAGRDGSGGSEFGGKIVVFFQK